MRLRLAVASLGLFAACGCSRDHRIDVQSDGCWDETVNGERVDSQCGNASYHVNGKLDCVTVQKRGNDGYVRVRIDGGAWTETTAPLGEVTACQ